MKIGTFGAGNMARAIAGGLARQGHEVMFGSRDAEKAGRIADEVGHRSLGGTNSSVADFADAVIHTVRHVPSEFLESTASLNGKVVIDVNNRDFPRDITAEPLFPSLFAQNQADVPGATVVKCFNTMAMEVFDHRPETLRQFAVNAFIAGGSEEARRVVADLASDLGFEPMDLGGPENADLVEIQGDFIRAAMFHQQNFLLTSQIREIPVPAESLTGGRRDGTY